MGCKAPVLSQQKHLIDMGFQMEVLLDFQKLASRSWSDSKTVAWCFCSSHLIFFCLYLPNLNALILLAASVLLSVVFPTFPMGVCALSLSCQVLELLGSPCDEDPSLGTAQKKNLPLFNESQICNCGSPSPPKSFGEGFMLELNLRQ